MLVSDISGQVKTRCPKVEASDLALYIASAVRFYSRYNPVVAVELIPIVVDEQTYDWPDDAIGIRKVEWWPTGESLTSFSSNEFPFPPVQPHQPSLDVIRAINRAASSKRQRGLWRVEGRTICISPVPDANATDLRVTYTMLHVVVAGNYDTIPDEDLDIVRDLTLAEVYQAEGQELLLEPDYTVGLQSVRYPRISSNLRDVIIDLRSGLKSKYRSPSVSST